LQLTSTGDRNADAGGYVLNALGETCLDAPEIITDNAYSHTACHCWRSPPPWLSESEAKVGADRED